MRGVCYFATGKPGGFATLGVVVMLLLILASVALLTRDLLQSELQNGQGEVAFRQAELDAESRLGAAMAILARSRSEPAAGTRLGDGVTWRHETTESSVSPILTLVARGQDASRQTQASVQQQVSWLPVMARWPSIPVLIPNLTPAQLSQLTSIHDSTTGTEHSSAPTLGTIQQELDQLFAEQEEAGARIRWLEEQASLQQQDCSELDEQSSGLILILGSCEPLASIGSSDGPVILLIRDGGLFLSSNQTIHGVVVLYSSTTEEGGVASVQIADDAQVVGALISQHSLSVPNIIARVTPSTAVQRQIATSSSFWRLVRVAASWRDW